MSLTLVIKTKLLKTSRLRRALSKASITWDHPCYLFTYSATMRAIMALALAQYEDLF